MRKLLVLSIFFLSPLSVVAETDCASISNFEGDFQMESSSCSDQFGSDYSVDEFVTQSGETVYRLINSAIGLFVGSSSDLCEITKNGVRVDGGDNLNLEFSGGSLAVEYKGCWGFFSKIK